MGRRNLHNLLMYWIRGALYGVAVLFANGTIIQTYLAACGLTPAEIGVRRCSMSWETVCRQSAWNARSPCMRRVPRPIRCCALSTDVRVF